MAEKVYTQQPLEKFLNYVEHNNYSSWMKCHMLINARYLAIFYFLVKQVKEAVIADENFSVAVNKSSYEIIATYKKEETGMDLVIRLSSSYPLRPVDVECTRSLGISEVKQRKWLLSLSAFVRSQVPLTFCVPSILLNCFLDLNVPNEFAFCAEET